MATKGIYNLTGESCSVQRTRFMHNDNNFSQSASSELHTEEVFGKFSPSKAMLVEDGSKRTLSTDREMAVPPKKRRQLHQDSELCDVFIDQNLQKNEPNERDMAFCPKLEKENLCTSTPSEKGLKEGKIEFHLQPSINVKTDEYAEWFKLKCFESITDDGSSRATFFAGGPVQSSAFSITSHDLRVNQYVAVAAGNAIYNDYSCSNTQNVSGIIQFWNVGSLHERKTLNQSPSMELALCHDTGIITQMKWCPADCYDKSTSTCHLPRLGLLAAATSSSYVYIYIVPQPDFMQKLKHTFPIYFTRPFIKLTPLFGGPSNATKKAAATCIDWEKNGEQIVAGYANGAVCVWRINVSSFASNIAVKNEEQSYVIQSYLFFQASGAGIANLSFAPFNSHRWLAVSSMDKVLRFFDLHDTSAPFHVAKLGWENSSIIWSDAFCGVYSSPALSNNGLISLSTKDCCTEGVQKGYFDSSAPVAASEKGNCHAIADMGGAVTVNFLEKIDKPLETSYITLMLFETEIMTLDITGMEQEASKQNICISGNIPSHNLISDAKDTSYTKINQESSSSSSGFGSPNHDKTIVIEMAQCFDGDTVNLFKSPPGSSLNESQDINNNGMKPFSNKPLNSGDEADDDMIKCPESSKCFMRDLLMKKISNQLKCSSDILQLNTSNNFAHSVSKGAKYLSDKALITSSTAIDCTGDRIMYPIKPCFCDTSHSNPFMSVESSAQSCSLGLNDERNTLCETTVHKKNEKSKEPSSNNWYDPNSENCNLNHKSRNLRKINNCNLFHSNDITPPHSDIPGKECQGSKKFPNETIKSEDVPFQHLISKDNVIFKKDNIKLSTSESFYSPLCDVLKSNNLNQPKLLPDMPLSITSNNDIICDKDDLQVFDRASIQSNPTSDNSEATILYLPSDASDDSTITYWDESYDCDKTDINDLIEKLGDTFQSLSKSEIENTFQKVKEVVINAAKTKLLTENSSFAREKHKHFLTKESLKKSSEYGTDSTTGSSNLDDEARSFFSKDFFISHNFQLLDSKYLSEKSEEKHYDLNELPATPETASQCSADLATEAPRNLSTKGIKPGPESYKNSHDLSYESLIKSSGVIFKNNLDEFTNPLKHQENDIYIKYNPLSVIKTMSWDPNEGCQSWLFLGGNSGICRIIYVPDFVAGKQKKPQSLSKKRQQPKRFTTA